MNYKKSAEELLNAIGGEDNLDAMAHCATRLRLVLKDESLVDEKVLNDMDVVKGTFSTGGQYQIIIGSGSAKVSAARLSRQIVKLLESDDVSYDELVAINGLGDAKTCQILAAIEFGMRINTNAIREKHSTSANNHLSTSLIKLARSHPNNILAAWLNGAGNVCGSKFYKNLNYAKLQNN